MKEKKVLKKTLSFLILILNLSLYSQNTITITVVDSVNNLPIKNVTITNIDSQVKSYTNTNGTSILTSFGIFDISKIGYKTQRSEINNTQNITIKLEADTTTLDEVIINNFSLPLQYKNATDAVAIVNSKEINRGNTLELHPILNKVPGVFMQSGTLNTNRISIRGIGARNLFGTANIRAYFEDIPLTDGNGESSIEDLELAALSSIEIHKGPSSSSYGVGLGGTILLTSQYAYANTTEGSIGTTVGSYGLIRVLAKASVSGGRSNIKIVYSNNHSDGYRNNNTYDRNTFTATSSVYLGKKDALSIFGSVVNLKAGIPSSLNQEDFNNSPRQAAFTWGQAQGFEDVDYGIAGVTWKHNYTTKVSQNTSVFTALRKNYEPRPFNILEEKSNNFGIRTRILGEHKLARKTINWTLGAELFYESYNSKTFDNLYQDFPIGTGSVQGDLLSDLDEKRYYYNFFGETNLNINQKLRFNLGVHLNQTNFDIDDLFLSDGENSSGEFDFDPILSPKIGVNYAMNTNITLFGNIAHGFSTPTASETLLPDGLFNADIKPEIGWNYEVGARYKLLNGKLYGSLSLYTLRIEDLLVARRTVDDNFFAINAGKTTHNGLEAEINYTVHTFKSSQLNFFINGSIYDYTFKDFIDLDNDFSGNDLTGVPSEVINIGIDLYADKGFYGNLNLQTVGEIPVNDANSVLSDGYELLHGKIGFRNAIGKHFFYDFSVGANNLLDTKYASQIQINARGFGGNAPRYFYSGLPFNIYGGINIKYRL
ncbi:hypothetical protein AWE51_18300 [Aquimarina aggregata]|uniref:TonB-dependent receptor n=1 Tax=Aquimarina aggregata TaxID=1642818 RepID=A0A162X938_9FLAO|nr:hypothetical protein AWE51_18300 [Aquimarina aggregata]